MIEIGLKHTSELTVTDAVTAVTIGSGDMPVLATPMMMALMESYAGCQSGLARRQYHRRRTNHFVASETL